MAGINRSIRIFVNGKEVEHSLANVRKESCELLWLMCLIIF